MPFVKRGIALLLCVLMALSLTACGGDTPIDGSQPAGSQPDGSQITGGKLWDPTGVNFDGRHFIIGMPGAWGPVRGKREADDLYLDQIEKVENTYNCTVEYKEFPNSGFQDMISTTALGGTYVADIMYTGTGNAYPGYAKSGLVISPDDYNIFNYEDDKWNKAVAALNYNGKRYTFTTLAFDSYNDLGGGVWFNKDMFERHSLTSPYEYYNNGTWTWDVMKELSFALTQDFDNDGTVDQYGITVCTDHYSFLFANGARLVTQAEDGTYKYALNSPEAIEALEYYVDFKNTDAHAPWLGDEYNSRTKPFVEGKIGMYVANVSRASTYLKDGMEDDYGWVPFPKGPSADTYQLYASGCSTYIVPAPVPDPVQVFQVYDLITDWVHGEGVDACALFAEARVRDEQTVENLRAAYNGGWNVHDLSSFVSGMGNVARQSLSNAWSGKVSIKTAMDSIESACQQMIDQSLNTLQ